MDNVQTYLSAKSLGSEKAQATMFIWIVDVYIQIQGVVTYMSHVEAFVTRIKIEPSDQSHFRGPIKGSR